MRVIFRLYPLSCWRGQFRERSGMNERVFRIALLRPEMIHGQICNGQRREVSRLSALLILSVSFNSPSSLLNKCVTEKKKKKKMLRFRIKVFARIHFVWMIRQKEDKPDAFVRNPWPLAYSFSHFLILLIIFVRTKAWPKTRSTIINDVMVLFYCLYNVGNAGHLC